MFKKTEQFIAPKWRPLDCRPGDLITAMRESLLIGAPIARFIIEYKGARHKLGVYANYSHGKWSNAEFYLDSERYTEIDEFCKKCSIDGERFVDIEFISILEDEDGGDPRNNVFLEKIGIR